jgi:hypothetical protein
MDCEKYRERYVVSRYETLSAKEEEEWRLHFKECEPCRLFQREMDAIHTGLCQCSDVSIPLSGEDVLAQLKRAPVASLPTMQPVRQLWKRGLAVAASMVLAFTIWAQGLAVQVGSFSVAIGGGDGFSSRTVELDTLKQQVAALSKERGKHLEQMVNAKVRQSMTPMVASLQEYVDASAKNQETFYAKVNELVADTNLVYNKKFDLIEGHYLDTATASNGMMRNVNYNSGVK